MTSTFPVCSCVVLGLRSLSLGPLNLRGRNQSMLLSTSSLGTERVSDRLGLAQCSPEGQ